MNILTIALGAILMNNFIFSQFLGCCPFLGCSTKVDTAVGMGIAVTFVMGLATAICYAVNLLLVAARTSRYMSTLAFILVIAVLVQFVEMFLKKSVPSALHRARHLPAAHHHQLRRPRRRAAERAEQLRLHRERRLRHHRRPRLPRSPSSSSPPSATGSSSPTIRRASTASR